MKNQDTSIKTIKKLGDMHDGRATVLIEQNGNRWIRKPRNARTEVAFKTFLSILEEEGFIYIPGTVNIISDSSWFHDVEIVEQHQVDTVQEIHLFYRRFGALLFFTYLFSSTDMHCENIVANGAFPTVVDYETLLSGEISRRPLIYKKSLVNTVISSHMLPNWSRKDEQDQDKSGISGQNRNRLIFQGEYIKPYLYKSDILCGFSYAYEFALNKKDLFRRLIRLFDNCIFRVLLRPTELYVELARYIRGKPSEERERIARELLSRAYLQDIDKKRIEKTKYVLDYEIKSVLNEEVPLLFVQATKLSLFNRGGLLQDNFLEKTPIQNTMERINCLSVQDCRDQSEIIKQSLEAVQPISDKESYVESRDDIYMSIIKNLERRSVSCLASSWLQLGRSDKGCLYLESVGFGIYDGLIGILCCYAAVYYRTHNEDVLKVLLTHYEKYRKYAIPNYIPFNSQTVNLQSGVGGQILALCHIADLTGIDIFREDAIALAKAIDLSNPLPHGKTDIIGGYAGLAIALPKIPVDIALPIAEMIAPMLMNAKVYLSGYGHGAAGISLALGSMGFLLNTDIYNQKILDLLKWENQFYDINSLNWYDLRSIELKGFMSGWCSGAPGIGMARKRLRERSKSEDIQKICEMDVIRVKTMLKECIPLKKDHLCCGNSARLMASSNLGIRNDNLYDFLKHQILFESINLIHTANTCDCIPGLMQGYAGVGYALAMYGNDRSGEMLL